MLRPLIYIGAGEHININTIMEFEVVNIFDRPMTLLTGVMLKANEKNGDNIKKTTIGDFVDPKRQYQYIEKIQRIRELCPNLDEKLLNKSVVDVMKKALPAGIISGVATDGIGEVNIVERNGVIAFDIDAGDNPSLYDWEAVKATISKSPFVAYTGLSISGLGIWGMIPVQDAMKHKEHFNAIVEDFAKTTFTVMQNQDTEPTVVQGIKLDLAPSNIASKRFISYDPHPYINRNAVIYTKKKEPVKLYDWNYTTNSTGGNLDIEAFFKRHNISFTARARHGGTQYIVECPWIAEHSTSPSRADSAVFVYPDGTIGYKCLHAHCADRHWRHYREFYEPGCYDSF